MEENKPYTFIANNIPGFDSVKQFDIVAMSST